MHSQQHLVRAAGWTLVVGSVIGACCAAVVIAWPVEVPPSRYSHPFGPATFVAAQLVFAVRHLAETVGVVGLILLLWRTAGGLLRTGLALSLAGTLLLVAMELVAITAADTAADSAAAAVVNTGYAVPTLVLGVGLLLAGIGVARTGGLGRGPARWIVLVCGAYMFVVLLPALFGPLVVGRVAIGLWTLLMAGIGLAVVRAVTPSRARVEAVPA